MLNEHWKNYEFHVTDKMSVILHCLKLQYSAVGNICLVVLCFVFDASASTENSYTSA